MTNYFEELNKIDCKDKIEKKNGLSYLSWAWAWTEVKKKHPDAFYTIYENLQGWFYHTDGKTGWVKTGVTIDGLEHIEYLPIMDFRNKSIPVDNITSFDVNKAIQRSLTKAVARHGLGLYIYAGEDMPEDTEEPQSKSPAQKAAQTRAENTKSFEERFLNCYKYLKSEKATWSYNLEERFNAIMAEAEKRRYDPDKQGEMYTIFNKLPKDKLPDFDVPTDETAGSQA